MATNTGKNHRAGEVRERSQVRNPRTGDYAPTEDRSAWSRSERCSRAFTALQFAGSRAGSGRRRGAIIEWVFGDAQQRVLRPGPGQFDMASLRHELAATLSGWSADRSGTRTDNPQARGDRVIEPGSVGQAPILWFSHLWPSDGGRGDGHWPGGR